MPNLAALYVAVSTLSAKKTMGHNTYVPSGRARVKVQGQPVTYEVRSSAEMWRKPVIADNFVFDEARTKF